MPAEDITVLSFFVNGKKYTLCDFDPTFSLNYWLRNEAGLTGTKLMCNEGGCGSCVVLLQYPSQKPKIVNSVSACVLEIHGTVLSQYYV